MTSNEDSAKAKEEKAGLLPSTELEVDMPRDEHDDGRPSNIRAVSSPAYESPIRHHEKSPTSPREIKETLHAHSEYTNSNDDGAAIHRINQYVIKQEIGRGSFGAVHLAVDHEGKEYAVKEFSKSRLRKRAQSNILRRPHAAMRKPGPFSSALNLNSPLHRALSSGERDAEAAKNPLYLIKKEIAIMKKLNHPNLVSLIEVLDDPTEDSLYIVMEMCHKGVVMKVGVDQKAQPYDEESCRYFFRDLILGIEYLHAQGVVHRDIKPDNLLITTEDVLKVVDFGVSEMFEKESPMMIAKSAGSPAFLPPELCIAKHGDMSGKAADIWSMGVTLYCMRFGHLPFEQQAVVDLYESIKQDDIHLEQEPEVEDTFKDLIVRILEKDPDKRIDMPELRDHPWVTKGGSDPLLSMEENTANVVEPPTEEETDQAITSNIKNVVVMMKAVKKFKDNINQKKASGLNSMLSKDGSLARHPRLVSAFGACTPPTLRKTQSMDVSDRKPLQGALAVDGLHQALASGPEGHVPGTETDSSLSNMEDTPAHKSDTALHHARTASDLEGRRDLHVNPSEHRHLLAKTSSGASETLGPLSPLDELHYLNLGPGGTEDAPNPPAISESPPAVEGNIYEKAYQREIERIRDQQGRSATLFLTRRVEKVEGFLKDQGLIRGHETSSAGSRAISSLTKTIDAARAMANEKLESWEKPEEKTETETETGDTQSKDEQVKSSLANPFSMKKGGKLDSFSKLVDQAKTMAKEGASEAMSYTGANDRT